MVQNIITDLCHHLEIGIDGNLDIGNKRVIVGTPTITLTNNILTISCDTVGASIYYTLDGNTPTSNSIRYTSAVTLSNNCTIKAIAIKDNKYSAIVEETYVKPITYLTQWKIVGNSEVHGNEIWSCGEYNPIDGKYHILVQPLGGSVADIALDEPLRKVNDVTDTIEFPSDTDGKALVTRFLSSVDLGNFTYITNAINAFTATSKLPGALNPLNDDSKFNGLIADFEVVSANQLYIGASNDTLSRNSISLKSTIRVFDPNYKGADPQAMRSRLNSVELIYELATPTTELIDAPQIAEAESYSCVISQGAKAVSWSDFIYDSDYLLTDSENNILVDSENYQLTVQS